MTVSYENATSLKRKLRPKISQCTLDFFSRTKVYQINVTKIKVIKSILQRTKDITTPEFIEKAQANKDHTEVCTVFSANYGVGVFDHKSNRTLA